MRNLNILVVDDDPVTRKLIEKKLAPAGFSITLAENGRRALEHMGRELFDVVITDLMMPGEPDGIGVLKAARKKSGYTEVLLLTGHASVDTAVEAMKAGAADYLQKPVNFHELMIRLDRIAEYKNLSKTALDLREAMDVTECAAAETIQELELRAAVLQDVLHKIGETLRQTDLAPDQRLAMVESHLSAAFTEVS